LIKKYEVKLSKIKPIILIWVISLSFIFVGTYTSLVVFTPLGILLFILTSLLLGALLPTLIVSKLFTRFLIS
ncbi:MAG: hypothetical protein QW723_05625, partial [Candidatus Bathyarchaeia archaeon]